MIQLFFDTSYHIKAKRVIEKIEVDGNFRKVFFKKIARPLFYPLEASLSSLECVICECFYDSNWHYYEIPETRVEANDIVVDCGAAEGLFGLLIFQRCKQAYMIEPLASFCESLQRTFEKVENVEVLQLGVSSEEGYATISESDISSSLSLGEGAVKVSTLDKLFFEKDISVSYIKIDVEGFDLDVLKGAEQLIKKNKPKIAVTTYHNIDHAKLIEDFLLSIVPSYKIRNKGISQYTGSPIMLHAWI